MQLDIISTIKSKVNFFDLVHIKQGNRTVCPIHRGADNPTSFSIYKDGEFAKCFSCDFSGDIISFIQRKEKLLFIPALDYLAKKAGIDARIDHDVDYSSHEKIRVILRRAIEMWHMNLMKNAEALQYLLDRGLTQEIITEQLMGYAGGMGELTRPLLKEGWKYSEMDAAGLTKKQREYYEYRYVFPYWHKGDVVYSVSRRDDVKHGRDNGKVPKYMKHKIMPGIQHKVYGQDAIYERNKTLIITEGLFDYWSAKMMGYESISPITGHFSGPQFAEIAPKLKGIRNLYICFDWDRQTKTGQRSAWGLAQKLRSKGVNAKIIELKAPKDWSEDSYDLSNHLRLGLAMPLEGVKSFDEISMDLIDSFDDLADFLKMVARVSSLTDLERIKDYIVKNSEFSAAQVGTILKSLRKMSQAEIAEQILKEHDIVYNAAHGFKEYKGGRWKEISTSEVELWIKGKMEDEVTGPRLNSARQVLGVECNLHGEDGTDPFNVESYRVRYVPLLNGFFDLERWNIVDPIREAYFTFKFNVKFDPTAICPEWKKFIQDVTADDDEQTALLQEIFGYCMLPDNRFQKFFVFYGHGSNGKSRFIEVIEDIVGDAGATVPLSRFSEPFAVYDLYGKCVSTSTEDKSDFIECTNTLKAVVSGDMIRAERKFRDSFRFRPYAKIIVAMNEMPKSRDVSFGFFRRMELLDWKVRFIDERGATELQPPYIMKQDLMIGEKLRKEHSGIFNWALVGLKRLITTNTFTRSEAHVALQREFFDTSNLVALFFTMSYEDKALEKGETYTKRDIYMQYRTWCATEGHHPLSSIWFFRNATSIKATSETFRQVVDGKQERCAIVHRPRL